MQTADQILQAIRKLGAKRLPLTRVYRSLFSEDLFFAAYGKIYKNEGALTPGSDEDDTADGMTIDIIRTIIEQLRSERFRFKPARRSYAEKKNGGQRPLGMPNFSEKLVQEVIRMILDAYYEPRFSDSSHGFRPGRGCHTALTDLHHRFRAASWFIEGDIRQCFDSMDHTVLMDILSRDIQDGRFLNLIRMGLQAGILEDWDYQPTLSGVPQGGIVSPVLSNIYLHELDMFIENRLIPRFSRGKERARNPEYRHLEYLISEAHKRGDLEEVRRLKKERNHIPSKDTRDPHFRRLRYVRYADDFILAFAGPKSEAEEIKAIIGESLRDKLHLELNTDKTLITHARTEHARFLGYAISIYQEDGKQTRTKRTKQRRRSVNGHVRLGIPYGLVTERTRYYERGGKPVSELAMLTYSDAHIIDTYQARFRGIAEYYKFAEDRHHLSKLKNTMQAALVKTLAHKYKLTVSKVYRKYRATKEVKGETYKTLEARVPTKYGERVFYWGAIPLKRVKPSNSCPIYDMPTREYPRGDRSDLIQRLLANTCEMCGREIQCEVHHVRKLADLKKRWAGRRKKPEWVVRMIAIHRKTLVVCCDCHHDIHAGRPIPNSRRQTGRESRVI
jgi:group II intron reverse transcriptase/maturase